MKKVVQREWNKTYYRVLHVPIWVWVFWVLPGQLSYALFARGPDRRHWVWLAIVVAACAWRGYLGRLPGVEPRPYLTHWGVDQPNQGYRVVCYAAAWAVLLVPFALNAISLGIAAATGRWMVAELYAWLYYPMLLAVAAATWGDWVPRAKRSTRDEGAERAWFYVAIWTVVPAQAVGWGVWRLGGRLALEGLALARLRLAAFLVVTCILFYLGLKGRLPRTARYYSPEGARPGAREPAMGA